LVRHAHLIEQIEKHPFLCSSISMISTRQVPEWSIGRGHRTSAVTFMLIPLLDKIGPRGPRTPERLVPVPASALMKVGIEVSWPVGPSQRFPTSRWRHRRDKLL